MNDNEKTLVRLLKTRLGANLFKDPELLDFIKLGVSAYNCFPPESFYDLQDEGFTEQVSSIIVQYAYYSVLTTMALKERGREYIQIDNGVEYTPPVISDLCYQIAKDEYEKWINLVSANKKLNEILASLDDQEEFVEVSDEQDDVN